MFECNKCGEKFKTRQGLRGHEQFKHSDFVKVKMKKGKADRILIGDKVVRIDELAIDLDSAVKLKKHAMEREETTEEVIDHLTSLIKLEEQTKEFFYTDCNLCGLFFWAPKNDTLQIDKFFCPYCAEEMEWA